MGQGRRYHFGLSISRPKQGTPQWTVSKPLLTLDGGKSEGYQTVLQARAVRRARRYRWHRLAIRTQGKRHQILLDDQLLFQGEDDRISSGGLSLAPGWGWYQPIPYVEVDDLVIHTVQSR